MQQADQPAGQEYSFAGALFSFPVAEGCAEPEQHAPDSWRQDFEQLFADAEVCQGLAISCKPGRDWLHQAAPRLTASLDVSLGPAPFSTRQWAVSDLIKQRQPLPTTLLLTADTLSAPDSDDAAQKRVLKQRRSSIRRSRASYQLSAAYKAVTSLILSHSIRHNDPALPLFLPRLSGVTQLRVDRVLTDEWVGLLVTHLPCLDTLTVRSLDLYPRSADLRCPWTRLVLTDNNSNVLCDVQDIANAPMPSNRRQLTVELPKDKSLVACAYAEGLDGRFTDRFDRLVFQSGAGLYLDPEQDDTPSLLAALLDLAELKLSGRKLHLRTWPMDATNIHTIAANTTGYGVHFLPSCTWPEPPHSVISQQLSNVVHLALQGHPLTDELLTAVLVHCRGLEVLHVSKLALKRSHAHWVAEAWRALVMDEEQWVDWEQIERLPQPRREAYCLFYVRRGEIHHCTYQVEVYPSMTVNAAKVPDNVNYTTAKYVVCQLPTSALMRLTTLATLPAADQAAALQSALDRAAAADIVPSGLHLHLTDFTLGPELERVLAGAKASGRDVCVSMVGGRCSRRGLALAAPLPPFTRLELVGMCDERTETVQADAAAAAQQPAQPPPQPARPPQQQLVQQQPQPQPYQQHAPAAPLLLHTGPVQHHMGTVHVHRPASVGPYTAAAQVCVHAAPAAVMAAQMVVHAAPAVVSTVPAAPYVAHAAMTTMPVHVTPMTVCVTPAVAVPGGAQTALATAMPVVPTHSVLHPAQTAAAAPLATALLYHTVPAQPHVHTYLTPASQHATPAPAAYVAPAPAPAMAAPAYQLTCPQQAFGHLPVADPLGRPVVGTCSLGRPLAVTGNQYGSQTWVVSVRQLLRLLHYSGGAYHLMLQDCVLAFDLETTEEYTAYLPGLRLVSFHVQQGYPTPGPVGTQLMPVGCMGTLSSYQPMAVNAHNSPCRLSVPALFKTFKLQLSHPGITQYEICPPYPHMPPAAQTVAMQASCHALSLFTKPDVVTYTGDWLVCTELVSAMPAAAARRAVVFGPDMAWSAQATTPAACVCQQLGQKLLSDPHTDLIVHDTCGVFNLAHVLMGRHIGAQSSVYVVTAQQDFKSALHTELSRCCGAGTPLPQGIRMCAEPPMLAPTPPTPEQQAADRTAQIDKYKRAQWEGERVAAGLRGEADIAERAGRLADAAGLRERASEVVGMAAQAAQVVSTYEQGAVPEPVPEIDCGLAARLWREFVSGQ